MTTQAISSGAAPYITQAVETVPLRTLSDEMILTIFEKLDLSTFRKLQLTCWQFYNLLQDNSLWKTLFKSDFPSCRLPPFPSFRESYVHRHRFHTNFSNEAYTTHVIKGQNTLINALVVADGKIIVGSNDIEIFDLATGKPLMTLLMLEDSACISLYASGDRFFVGSTDGTIDVFDLKTLIVDKTLRGHGDRVTCLGSYGDHLISGSMDNTIRIWDVDTWESQSLEGHENGIVSLVVTPEGKLYTGSLDKTIRVWDLKTRQFERILEGHQEGVMSLAFDGEYLISGSLDKTIKVWDLKNCICSKTLKTDTAIYRLAGIEGKIVSTSGHLTNRVWDLQREVSLYTLDGPWNFNDSVFENDKLFIAAGSEVWIYDFQARDADIFREIANLLPQPKTGPEALTRFNQMPQKARKKIQEKHNRMMNPSGSFDSLSNSFAWTNTTAYRKAKAILAYLDDEEKNKEEGKK